MEVNQSVWDYYPRDDKKYMDPLYLPYQTTLVKSCEAQGELCPVNPYKVQGYSDGLVHPELVRKGWSTDFQLMHPDKDPCPEGWTKTSGGWCVANKAEYGDHGLYSKDAFIPKYQYWNSYAPRRACPANREINEFDNRSVNPFTGNYVRYFSGKVPKNRYRYGALPSKDSLLA